jgi:hypothetical protein
MRDIDHISVSVGPPVTRDYRIDRNSTVLYIRDLTDDIHYASVLETSSDRDERVCSSDRYDEILVSML